MPHDDALVITLELASTIFSKILVNTGSTVNVVSQNTLRSISQPTQVIDHEMTPLNSIEGKSVRSLGIVPLTTKTYDDETRYPVMEKLALAVVTAVQKLRPYFQSHSIMVMTSQPLRTVLHSPSQSGRLAK